MQPNESQSSFTSSFGRWITLELNKLMNGIKCDKRAEIIDRIIASLCAEQSLDDNASFIEEIIGKNNIIDTIKDVLQCRSDISSKLPIKKITILMCRFLHAVIIFLIGNI